MLLNFVLISKIPRTIDTEKRWGNTKNLVEMLILLLGGYAKPPFNISLWRYAKFVFGELIQNVRTPKFHRILTHPQTEKADPVQSKTSILAQNWRYYAI